MELGATPKYYLDNAGLEIFHSLMGDGGSGLHFNGDITAAGMDSAIVAGYYNVTADSNSLLRDSTLFVTPTTISNGTRYAQTLIASGIDWVNGDTPTTGTSSKEPLASSIRTRIGSDTGSGVRWNEWSFTTTSSDMSATMMQNINPLTANQAGIYSLIGYSFPYTGDDPVGGSAGTIISISSSAPMGAGNGDLKLYICSKDQYGQQREGKVFINVDPYSTNMWKGWKEIGALDAATESRLTDIESRLTALETT